MNIVYIIEDYSENGGVEKIVSMKANTFYQEYHHQVTVISVYEDKRKQQYILDEGIRLIHLHVPFAKKTRNKVYKLLSRIITLLLAAYRLNKTIKQINPDVVFFTTTLGALYYLFVIQRQNEYTNHTWHVHSILFTHYSD